MAAAWQAFISKPSAAGRYAGEDDSVDRWVLGVGRTRCDRLRRRRAGARRTPPSQSDVAVGGRARQCAEVPFQ